MSSRSDGQNPVTNLKCERSWRLFQEIFQKVSQWELGSNDFHFHVRVDQSLTDRSRINRDFDVIPRGNELERVLERPRLDCKVSRSRQRVLNSQRTRRVKFFDIDLRAVRQPLGRPSLGLIRPSPSRYVCLAYTSLDCVQPSSATLKRMLTIVPVLSSVKSTSCGHVST